MYVGAIRFLEVHMDYKAFVHGLEGISGTSVGAVVGLGILVGMGHSDFEDMGVCAPVDIAPCPDISNLASSYGLDGGSAVRRVVHDILRRAGLSPDVTLGTLKRLTGKAFVCCSTNMNTYEAVYLSAETAPDLGVADAVFMSSCIPLLYTPFSHRGCLHVDGSLSDNLPCVFPVSETMFWGFEGEMIPTAIHTWTDYMRALLDLANDRGRHNQQSLAAHPHMIVFCVPKCYHSEARHMWQRRTFVKQMASVGYGTMLFHFRPDVLGSLRDLIFATVSLFLGMMRLPAQELCGGELVACPAND